MAHGATKRMIALAVDEGVAAADAALPQVGAPCVIVELSRRLLAEDAS